MVVDRANRRDAYDAFLKAGEQLKKGINMWNPASKVRLYFPNLSTMNSLLCGTILAVLIKTIIKNNDKIIITIENVSISPP